MLKFIIENWSKASYIMNKNKFSILRNTLIYRICVSLCNSTKQKLPDNKAR